MKSPFNPENELQYKYSQCKMKDGDSDEIGEFYCIYDVYDSGEESIVYLHDTDIISYYHRPFNADDSYPLMDEMGVKEIAETFLKNIVSEERFNTFAYSGMTMDALGRYALSYIRYVEGYPTDEVLSVWVDRCGDVSGYNGYNLQKYDSIEKTISKEKLDVAKKFL